MALPAEEHAQKGLVGLLCLASFLWCGNFKASLVTSPGVPLSHLPLCVPGLYFCTQETAQSLLVPLASRTSNSEANKEGCLWETNSSFSYLHTVSQAV